MTDKPRATSNPAESDPSIGDEQTVYRTDMTVMRDDPSVTGNTDSTGSWRSGASGGQPGVDAHAPKVLKQRFVLEELIGSGGMGSVFRAKDLRKVEARGNNPFIAVKVLNNDFRHHPEAFIALEREASKSQGLRHTNIVSIFDFDKDGDIPFITMELLQGDELADLLRTYPNGLPDELAWQVIEGMVLGLSHAHEEEVVHADFKPGNIYVTDRQITKILDFGIARAMRLNNGGEDTDFDPARLAALTPAYASREMLNGDNPEPRDDLYSLGVVTYMVLTGHHPYGRLPANDAAREGLKPERIRGLSRRRWRMLESCLQFNRQNRPATAKDVYEGLFGKPAWQSWSVAAAAALIAVSLGLVALQDNATIDEVKQEVRQETLMDAQFQRLEQLLADPQFDSAWEQRLFSELQTLRALTPDRSIAERVTARIAESYAEHITGITSLDQAFAQYEAGRKFGSMDKARADLHARLLDNMQALEQAPLNSDWLASAEQTLSYATRYFDRSSELTAARVELITQLNREIQRLIAAGDVLVAEQAWNTLGDETFEEPLWRATDKQLGDALRAAQERRVALVSERTERSMQQDLAGLLNVSCLRLDLGLVAARQQELNSQFPGHKDALNNQVGERVAECVKRLGALDPDRALSLQKDALSKFGQLAQLKGGGIDPCSPHYLVGNGIQAGRAGTCTDEISQQNRGPRLVVVPAGAAGSKFAISKYEISWRDFNGFCGDSGLCEAVDDEKLPVTGVSVEVVEAYAAWLSQKTGYRYRLPTRDEWHQVAQGEPDPNRNCRVDIGGIKRGDSMLAADSGAANPLGLVHVLGNVQELVKESADYVAVGGTFTDPIDACLADTRRTIDPQGDAQTGFRLVREVS